MHRLFGTYELVLELCTALAAYDRFKGPGIGRRSTRKDLSRFATTCKLICDPALDTLWEDLDGLYPLLRLFPTNREDSDLVRHLSLQITDKNFNNSTVLHRPFKSPRSIGHAFKSIRIEPKHWP
jgi:hypothetical protein